MCSADEGSDPASGKGQLTTCQRDFLISQLVQGVAEIIAASWLSGLSPLPCWNLRRASTYACFNLNYREPEHVCILGAEGESSRGIERPIGQADTATGMNPALFGTPWLDRQTNTPPARECLASEIKVWNMNLLWNFWLVYANNLNSGYCALLESNLEKMEENEGQKVISLQAEVPDPEAGQDFSVMLEMHARIRSTNAEGISDSGGFSWRIQTENRPKRNKGFGGNKNTPGVSCRKHTGTEHITPSDAEMPQEIYQNSTETAPKREETSERKPRRSTGCIAYCGEQQEQKGDAGIQNFQEGVRTLIFSIELSSSLLSDRFRKL
ncbi:hypothetical protein B0H14DRAFT_2603914 [Mycena olivaceomarginata]|nr:hypothetical protein B0H14DRAFT_2603914 [Mycena olivaceomarginata]